MKEDEARLEQERINFKTVKEVMRRISETEAGNS